MSFIYDFNEFPHIEEMEIDHTHRVGTKEYLKDNIAVVKRAMASLKERKPLYEGDVAKLMSYYRIMKKLQQAIYKLKSIHYTNLANKRI